MTDGGDARFTVKFGKVARTLDYADRDGILVFTFDGKGKEQDGLSILVLEHWAKATPRDLRYHEAFQRVRSSWNRAGTQWKSDANNNEAESRLRLQKTRGAISVL